MHERRDEPVVGRHGHEVHDEQPREIADVGLDRAEIGDGRLEVPPAEVRHAAEAHVRRHHRPCRRDDGGIAFITAAAARLEIEGVPVERAVRRGLGVEGDEAAGFARFDVEVVLEALGAPRRRVGVTDCLVDAIDVGRQVVQRVERRPAGPRSGRRWAAW